MLSVLIPVLKAGYLESQLKWLSEQTVKDFTVIVMDVNHSQNKNLPFIKQPYPFTFHYLPLIQNISYPKRFDYSIKNNLALLAPTEHFIFLSDTSYILPTFIETAINSIQRKIRSVYLCSSIEKVEDISAAEGKEKPIFLFDRHLFFHILNGFDECMTYGNGYEFIANRVVSTDCKLNLIPRQVFHIKHTPNENSFGKRSKQPCELCSKWFPQWKFDRAYSTGEFPNTGDDADIIDQHIEHDPVLGISTFLCNNCGFGGSLNPAEYQSTIVKNGFMDAPITALEGRTGRNLTKIQDTILRKIGTDMSAKAAYLMTTY